jgi:hypothetical protein
VTDTPAGAPAAVALVFEGNVWEQDVDRFQGALASARRRAAGPIRARTVGAASGNLQRCAA